MTSLKLRRPARKEIANVVVCPSSQVESFDLLQDGGVCTLSNALFTSSPSIARQSTLLGSSNMSFWISNISNSPLESASATHGEPRSPLVSPSSTHHGPKQHPRLRAPLIGSPAQHCKCERHSSQEPLTTHDRGVPLSASPTHHSLERAPLIVRRHLLEAPLGTASASATRGPLTTRE